MAIDKKMNLAKYYLFLAYFYFFHNNVNIHLANDLKKIIQLIKMKRALNIITKLSFVLKVLALNYNPFEIKQKLI